MNNNSVEIRVGRLMEIHVDKGFPSRVEVEEQRQMIAAALATIGHNVSVVIAADWRHCQLMSPEAANNLGPMIGSFNNRIERSGILASKTSPTTVLQFMRVIRESQHPNRKLFDEAAAMSGWLRELLTPAESTRLRQFLGA